MADSRVVVILLALWKVGPEVAARVHEPNYLEFSPVLIFLLVVDEIVGIASSNEDCLAFDEEESVGPF